MQMEQSELKSTHCGFCQSCVKTRKSMVNKAAICDCGGDGDGSDSGVGGGWLANE